VKISFLLLATAVATSKIVFKSKTADKSCTLENAAGSLHSACDIRVAKEVKGETHHDFSLRNLQEMIDATAEDVRSLTLNAACEPGHFKTAADQPCNTPCTKDTYDSHAYKWVGGLVEAKRFNSLSCATCPTDSYTSTIGLTKCDLCGPGKRFDASQANFCSACPVNMFSDGVSTDCKQCSGGRHTGGQRQQTSCNYCPAGQELVGEKCVDCKMAFSGTNDLSCKAYSKCGSGLGLRPQFNANSLNTKSFTTIYRSNNYYCESCPAKEYSDQASFSYCNLHSKCAVGHGAINEGQHGSDYHPSGGISNGDFDKARKGCQQCTGEFYSNANTFDVCYRAWSHEGYKVNRNGAQSSVSCAPGWWGQDHHIGYYSSGEVRPNQCARCNTHATTDSNHCGGNHNIQRRCSSTGGTQCCPSVPSNGYRNSGTTQSGRRPCHWECHGNYRKSGNSCVSATSYAQPRWMGIDNGRGANCGYRGHFFSRGCHGVGCIRQNTGYVTNEGQCQQAAREHGRGYGFALYRGWAWGTGLPYRAPYFPCGCFMYNNRYYFNDVWHGQHCSWWYPVRGAQICKK
jgi:hypothetical protein